MLAAFASVGLAGAPVRVAAGQEITGASGYRVAGTVVNDVTGQPLGRVEVILDNQQAMLTGGDGSFSFEHIPSGSYLLSIVKPGYSSIGGPGMGGAGYGGGGFHRFSSSATIIPPQRILVGPEMPSLTFRLTPLGSISGHLTLSTADPADEIHIHIFRRELRHGRPRWSLADVEKTRSDGSWRAAGLPAGHYLVQATASIDSPNDPENSRVPVWGFPALYYPGVTDVGSAGVLILKAGQQAQADMTLVRQRFFPVTIVMAGLPNTPATFEIMDSSGRPTGLPVHFDFRSGIAHANVPSGSWTLVAHTFGATMQVGRSDFQVTGAPVQVAVTVAPLPPIQVVIHGDVPASDGQPGNRWGWINLTLTPAEDFAEEGGMVSAHTEGSGDGIRMEVGVSQPGKFWANTSNPNSTYVASVSSGGTDLATDPLTVSPNSAPGTIEVTLRNDPGTIDGKVDMPAGGSGAPGEQTQVWIYAIPLFATTAQLPETHLQDNEQFSMSNLVPGSYRVVACDAPQEIEFHSQEGLAVWSGKGQVVSIDPSGTANVELSVIHGEVVE